MMPAPFHMFVPEITALMTTMHFAFLATQSGFLTTRDAFSINFYDVIKIAHYTSDTSKHV